MAKRDPRFEVVTDGEPGESPPVSAAEVALVSAAFPELLALMLMLEEDEEE